MKTHTFLLLSMILIGVVLFSCSSSKNNTMNQNTGGSGISSPPAIVYKTKMDYYENVPVMLSADKKKIVSYPAQSDLKRGGEFTYPTKLKNGYLLDNRGIGLNTVFLRFSYADYFNMDNIPTADRLLNYILDDDPFVEFYEVGQRGDYTDIEAQINEIISKNQLKKFQNQIK
jgi:hypothetical protein